MKMNKLFITIAVCCFAVSSLCDESKEVSSSSSSEEMGEVIIEIIKEKCKNITGSDENAENIVRAIENVYECIFNNTKLQELPDFIETQISLGVNTGLFNETCQQRDVVFQCIENEKEIFDKCLTEEEKADRELVLRVLRRIANTICIDDGEKITLFLVEKGPHCVESKFSNITNCLYESFGDSIESSEKFETSTYINDGNCNGLGTLQNCIVPLMAECPETEPSALINGIFSAVYDELNCPKKDVTNEI